MNRKELEEFNKTRKITQINLVTEDYMKTIKFLTENMQMGPWLIIENTNQSAHDVELNGEPVTEPWKFYLALTMVGDMQMEVIQPVYGPTPYDKFLKEKGPGVHHIKEGIPFKGGLPDNERLHERMKELEALGNRINYKGFYEEDIYYYLDLSDSIGIQYEVGNNAPVSCHPQLVGYYPAE